MKPNNIYRYRVFFRIPSPEKPAKSIIYYEGDDPAKGRNMVTEISSIGSEMNYKSLIDNVRWFLTQKSIYVKLTDIEILSVYRII